MIRPLNEIDTNSLVSAYQDIEVNIKWTEYGHKGKQAGIQYKPDSDPWTSAVGRREDDERKYNCLNPAFAGTQFEKIINQYGLVRTRLMWVYPYACYSMHVDEYPRVHVPLITNLGCCFVFPSDKNQQEIFHLPEGMVYWVDTTRLHTFINCSDIPRLHLVGVVER